MVTSIGSSRFLAVGAFLSAALPQCSSNGARRVIRRPGFERPAALCSVWKPFIPRRGGCRRCSNPFPSRDRSPLRPSQLEADRTWWRTSRRRTVHAPCEPTQRRAARERAPPARPGVPPAIARPPSLGIPTSSPLSPVERITLEKTAPADVERCCTAPISDMKLARSRGSGTLLMSVWYGAIRKFIPSMNSTKSNVIGMRGS